MIRKCIHCPTAPWEPMQKKINLWNPVNGKKTLRSHWGNELRFVFGVRGRSRISERWWLHSLVNLLWVLSGVNCISINKQKQKKTKKHRAKSTDLGLNYLELLPYNHSVSSQPRSGRGTDTGCLQQPAETLGLLRLSYPWVGFFFKSNCIVQGDTFGHTEGRFLGRT